MWVENGLAHLKFTSPKALTIGAFDGVHLGHQALIRWMIKGARSHTMEAVVLTFDPLPYQLFHSAENNLLSTLDERLATIRELGADGAIVLPFNREMLTSPANDFISQLVTHVYPGALWVGPDFRFGKDREGDLQFLKNAGKQNNFAVHVFEGAVDWDNEPVHSSRIRRALRAGNLKEVNGCLGHPYTLTGKIGHGEKRGRTLGFPTANLVPPTERMLPAFGVYIAQAYLGSARVLALVNIGIRPTFNNRPPNIEAYLLDFSGDIYGATLRLAFLHRLRPEMKFTSANALIAQMQDDELQARGWWEKNAQPGMDGIDSSDLWQD